MPAARTAALWLALLTLTVPGAASPEGDSTWDKLSRLPLLELRGDLAPVRYSPGSLQRASGLQDGFELLASQFAGWSGRKERLPLFLLNREEWSEAGLRLPYGLAARTSPSTVAVAAWGDAGTVDLWRRLLTGDLPTVDEPPMRSSADEAASLLGTDVLAIFEGARVLMESAGYRAAEPWITDLAAHIIAVTVVARMPGGGYLEAERLYGRLAARPGSAAPLSGYGPGLSIEEWLWYQARFFQGAAAVLDAEGRKTGKSLVRLARRNGGRIDRHALLERYPVLRAWSANGFADTAP